VALETPHVRDLAVQHVESYVRGRAELRRHQELLQVLAVERARHEVLAAGTGNASLHEFEEFVRRIGACGHAARGNVQQIRKAPIGIGDAAADCAATLDENDSRGSGRWSAQKICGHDRAAEAAADDRYRA
jgi:hypothetical protein